MISTYNQNNNLLNDIKNINNIDLINQIEQIISLKKQSLKNEINKPQSVQSYLNELIANAKSDFVKSDKIVNDDIDNVIAEMRGDYEFLFSVNLKMLFDYLGR